MNKEMYHFLLQAFWKDLQNRRELVVEWQDERDAIEGEAASFEVGDMERLRKVAKGE
jgi:hypothetical protein